LGKPLNKYCEIAWKDMLEVVFHYLTVRNSSLLEDEWNTVKASSNILSLFSQVVEDYSYVDRVLGFVGGIFYF
jgi:hypothetical protein